MYSVTPPLGTTLVGQEDGGEQGHHGGGHLGQEHDQVWSSSLLMHITSP
jgi:hypothetical protein